MLQGQPLAAAVTRAETGQPDRRHATGSGGARVRLAQTLAHPAQATSEPHARHRIAPGTAGVDRPAVSPL